VKWLRRLLRRRGYHLTRVSGGELAELDAYERRLAENAAPVSFNEAVSRLVELKKRYEAVTLPIANHSLWSSRAASRPNPRAGWSQGGIEVFRGGGRNSYVGPYGATDPLRARLLLFIFANSVRQRDGAGLLGRLREDGAFGCPTFEFPGLGRVSRDLLDSILEINFLERHAGILHRPGLRVLDIGAGYGRLAHRMLEARPDIASYACVDAVADSTFLCELYLRHRGLLDRVDVVPMDELDRVLRPGSFDLALNIHSFSECTYAAVEWWLQRLGEMRVPLLMIVPNQPDQFLAVEPDGRRRDYREVLARTGYSEVAREPVFDDPAVRELLVKDTMHLFRLSGG